MWKVNVRLQALLPRSTLAEQNALAAASGHERTFIFAARLLEAMAAPLAELQSARRAGALNETDAKALSLIEASHTQLTSGLTEGSVDRLRSAVASLRAFNERFDQTAPIHQTTTDFELEVGRVRPKNRERFEESLRATAQKTPAPASTGAAASSFDTGATARASPRCRPAPSFRRRRMRALV